VMPARRVLPLALVAFVAACSSWRPPAPPPEPAPVPPGPPDDVFQKPAPKKRPNTPAARFAAARDRILDRWLADEPSHARELGLHAADGKIGDYSAAGLRARYARVAKERKELAAFDKEKLSPDDALDRAILENQADVYLFEGQDLETWRHKPDFYQELFSVNDYLDRDYAPVAERAAKLLAHEKAALAAVPYVRENLVSPMSKPVLETAIKIYRGYAEYLRSDVPKQLKGVGTPAFQAELATTNDALAKAASALADWMEKSELPKGDQSHVLGPARFQKLLAAQEGLKISLAEFKRMGEADLAANQKLYDKLASRARVKRPKASELFAAAQALTERARQFVAEKRFATIPGDQKLVVKETPPFQRWNSAFLSAPGPFEKKTTTAFYYITLPDPKWSKKDQAEYVMPTGVLLSTTIHETYPGHFLQELFIDRAPTRVEKSIASYSFVEGWAHYGEQAMIELGFGGDDPANQLGQVSDALLRDCRYLVSLGIHTEGMTLKQAERKFMTDCKQDKATAREQAARGAFDPGYFAYTLGKLQILALRDEAKKKLGPKFDLAKFHDALLSHGSPPVPLLRERVLSDLGAK
ncbi:MAG TPA: DUF885 domain-containing protein, partial [Minicystis sp.]|nr:DUF885 domain-containing protein [Minicystis sp.]